MFFLFFSLKIYDSSLARVARNPRKIYNIDHSLIKSCNSGLLLNKGHMLENIVFIELKRRYKEIYYYKTQSGKEVDFIVLNRKIYKEGAVSKKIFQVSWIMESFETRKREVNSLYEAMAEQSVDEAFIITNDTEETLNKDGKYIRILPIWRFLLSDL